MQDCSKTGNSVFLQAEMIRIKDMKAMYSCFKRYPF
jgi:hypothetical protein